MINDQVMTKFLSDKAERGCAIKFSLEKSVGRFTRPNVLAPESGATRSSPLGIIKPLDLKCVGEISDVCGWRWVHGAFHHARA
jgi:hypothetical protein